MTSFLIEFLQFLKERKKYWLYPVIFVLLIFGLLIVLSQGSAIAPFIYTIFKQLMYCEFPYVITIMSSPCITRKKDFRSSKGKFD